MAFIKIPLDEAKESEAVPEGEYALRIIKVEDGESKKGNAMTTVTIRIEDPKYPEATPVRHWLTYPDSTTPPEQRSMQLLNTKRFLSVFKINIGNDGFDSEDLNGAEGKCLLVQEQADDGRVYNRLRLPRLKK